MKHQGCVTDPLAREWWRDYRHIIASGNPLGLSFVEYVAARVASLGTRIEVSNNSNAPWYMASCGHSHAWGVACTGLTT